MDGLERKTKELINKLHEIEDGFISDDILKSLIVTSGNQLKKVFGEGGKYDAYIQGGIATHGSEKNMLENTIRKDPKLYITLMKAATDGKNIDVIKNSILSNYLKKAKRIPIKEIEEIQNLFKKSNGDVEKLLETNNFDKTTVETLERYIIYLEDNKDFLVEKRKDIIESFKNPWSLHSILGHELAHHIFKEFTNLKGRSYPALNEGYSFAIQKALHLFDKEEISYEDIQKEILGLYKVVGTINDSYDQKQYKFMRSFILLIGGITIASAIGITENSHINQTLFNESYDQTTYTGLFSLYDKTISNIKDIKIRELLQQMKQTSINQLKKCKQILIDDARDAIDKFNNNDNIRIWAKMFMRTLELLSFTGEAKNNIIKLQKEYFEEFSDEIAGRIGYDEQKMESLEKIYTIVKNNEFKPQEIVDLIDQT